MSAENSRNEGQAFPFKKDHQVVIVAGGCDATFQLEMDKYSTLLAEAFLGYSGYIVSGGTTAGIPGMVGDLANPQNQFTRVGYLPAQLPAPEQRHPAYEFFRTTDRDDFSTLEPLQSWADLLASGINPENVRLLGINGGAISAFEFRLGLIMGATVGIVADSGRSASALVQDAHWGQEKNLIALPVDAGAIGSFLQT